MPHPRDMDDPSNWQIYSPERGDGKTDWLSKVFQAALWLAVLVFIIVALGIR